jgi:hypothetical protein
MPQTNTLAPLSPTIAAFRLRLRRLPLRRWADAGQALAAIEAAAVDDALQAARGRLREAVERLPDGATWIRRQVQELLAVADGMFHRSELYLMKKAALTAALALAARDLLDPQDFALLYGPFEALIPLAEIEAESQSQPAVSMA